MKKTVMILVAILLLANMAGCASLDYSGDNSGGQPGRYRSGHSGH